MYAYLCFQLYTFHVHVYSCMRMCGAGHPFINCAFHVHECVCIHACVRVVLDILTFISSIAISCFPLSAVPPNEWPTGCFLGDSVSISLLRPSHHSFQRAIARTLTSILAICKWEYIVLTLLFILIFEKERDDTLHFLSVSLCFLLLYEIV